MVIHYCYKYRLNTFNRVKFAHCNFCPSTLAISPCLEFAQAQLCFKRDKIWDFAHPFTRVKIKHGQIVPCIQYTHTLPCLLLCFSGTSYNNPAVHYLDYFYPSFPGTRRNQQCWWRPPLLQGSPHYTTHWERPAGSQSPTGLECPHTAGRSEAYRRPNKHTNAPYLQRGKRSCIHIH